MERLQGFRKVPGVAVGDTTWAYLVYASKSNEQRPKAIRIGPGSSAGLYSEVQNNRCNHGGRTKGEAWALLTWGWGELQNHVCRLVFKGTSPAF